MLSEMLFFPDCNQYLRKNLSKVPHQSILKSSEIRKKHSGQASKKLLFFQSVLFSKCARKGSQTRHTPLTFELTFELFFGPGWPVSPKPPRTLFAIQFCCKNHENHYLFTIPDVFCCILFVCTHVHGHAFLCNLFRLL